MVSLDLAILVPVLHRPHRVVPLLDSIEATTPDAAVHFICDPFDRMEISEVKMGGGRGRCFCHIVKGNYAVKINTLVGATDTPLLFLGADDLEFHPGWLDAAKRKLAPGIGVVGTNDLCNKRVMRGQHSTHSLLTREYAQRGTIDEPDKVLHEGYEHEFVDDEFIATAKHRQAFAHAADSIVEHLHPMVGKAPLDRLYQRQSQRMKTGKVIYKQRRALWT